MDLNIELRVIPSPRLGKKAVQNFGKNLVSLKKKIGGSTESTLERFVLRARQALRIKGTVDVLVTSSREIQGLNRRFRNKNAATDVLSFPALGEARTRAKFAGDVVICGEIARQNAHRLGHATGDEVKILILHGMLHLAGYDHESDNGRMARREMKLRQELRLPAGLIERSEAASGARKSAGSKRNRPTSGAVLQRRR